MVSEPKPGELQPIFWGDGGLEYKPLRISADVRPRVIAFYPDPTACSFYRIIWPYQYLQASGLPCAFAHVSQIDKIDLSPYDVIVFQRIWPDSLENLAKWAEWRDRHKWCFVWEYDDSPFDTPEWNPVVEQVNERTLPIMEQMAKGCFAITTTTPHLARTLHRFGNPNVYVIPNSLFVEGYNSVTASDRKTEGLTIGTAGGFNHLEDWRLIVEPVKEILDKYPHVTFTSIGWWPDYFDELPADRVRKHVPGYNVDPNQWGKVLCNLDICLAPLVDIPFNWCKTPIKVQEAALVGAASVASPIVYGDVIRQGENGFIVYKPEDWVWRISKLIDQPKRRSLLVGRMAAEVRKSWNLQRNWPRWWQTYQHIWNRFQERDTVRPKAALWLPRRKG